MRFPLAWRFVFCSILLSFGLVSATVLPGVVSVTPTTVRVGDAITINGFNFTGATDVRFGAVIVTTGSFKVSKEGTVITATVPVGAINGTTVLVTTPDGISPSNPVKLTIQPKIDSITPSSGKGGDRVTIKGSGFTKTTAVEFNNITATPFTPVSDLALTVTVPAASNGKITVTTAAGTATSADNFLFAPQISTFQPLSAAEGSPITINGSNFLNLTQVTFSGGATATFTVNTAGTVVTTTVPPNARTGPVTVTGPGDSSTSTSLKILPKITSFTPTSAIAGESVTITGTALKVGVSNPTVKIGAVIAVVNSSSPTQINVTVAASTISGKISVTTTDGTGISVANFTVMTGR